MSTIRTRPYAGLDRDAIIDVLSDGLVNIVKDSTEASRLVGLLGLDAHVERSVRTHIDVLSGHAQDALNAASDLIRQHLQGVHP